MQKYQNTSLANSIFSLEERRVLREGGRLESASLDSDLRKIANPEAEKKVEAGIHNRMDDLKAKIEAPKLLAEIQNATTPEQKSMVVQKLNMNHVDEMVALGGKEVLKNTFIQNGVVNFYGNQQLERQVGLGELLGADQQYIKINDKTVKRVEGIRPYYENSNGRYAKIFTGYKVEFISSEKIANMPNSIKFPSDQKTPESIKQEQIALLKNSNPALAEKIEQGENLSKTEFFSVLKNTNVVLGKSWNISQEQQEAQRNMKFDQYIQEALGVENFSGVGSPASSEELEAKIKQFHFSPEVGKYMLPFFQAIAEQESGEKYSVLGEMLTSGGFAGQRAIGKYQIMASNWEDWSEEVMGEVAPPTAKNQDIVALYKMSQNFQRWINKGYTSEQAVELAAVNWYGNGRNKLLDYDSITTDKITTVAGKAFPSPKEYALSVLAKTKARMGNIV